MLPFPSRYYNDSTHKESPKPVKEKSILKVGCYYTCMYEDMENAKIRVFIATQSSKYFAVYPDGSCGDSFDSLLELEQSTTAKYIKETQNDRYKTI